MAEKTGGARREELERSIDVAFWRDIRPHLERGGIILVDSLLDLADVAGKVADDDTEQVARWIADGTVAKPAPDQIREWDCDAGRLFSIVIVRPYLLIREALESER